jgi:hypothetical protein
MSEHAHTEPLPDDQLLSNIKQGCSQCFAALFRRYCRQVYSVASGSLKRSVSATGMETWATWNGSSRRLPMPVES